MFIELTYKTGSKFLINKINIEKVLVKKHKEHDLSFWNSLIIYNNRQSISSDFVRETYEEIKKMLET